MDISPAGLALIKESEGCRLEAYRDAVGVWTIGYGHTGADVHEGLVWSQNQADAAVAEDAAKAAQAVRELVEASLTQGQFDALGDFVFNLGR
jgi:lysozyme